ncbi:enoyl-CoA hydratase/isomerase family protein [Halalkalibaculum sp. DA3122]|uniref:enoyl-CoA hydratase/isomerase family protein n=1 Tax=Halalkalibaculum sp. DA3122 TaxID=3373607 RepID=UPI0037552C71
MSTTLDVTAYEHILTATIQRPKAMNAINFELMDELERVLDHLENSRMRAFVLTGAGRDLFVSGGDLKEFHGIKSADEAEQMARRMGAILKRIERLPCWTIASINGSTYGGGWELMLAFDFRIASADATFHFSQGKFYLPPGWGGLTRLVEKVGRSTALRWLAETAEIDAGKALNYGLIDRLCPPDERTEKTYDWAKEMCKNDRDYIKTLKQGALAFSEARWKAIEQEIQPFARLWEDERHHTRVEKFLNKKD